MEVEVKTSEIVVYVLQVCWGTDTIMADAPPKKSRDQLNPNTGYWQGKA
jgi:hypothetical protein